MKVGRIQTLKVSRISDFGLYLADDEGAEVLLPNRYVSLTDKVGDEKSVFVYHDSENRLVATTEQPLITEGHVACLKVVDKNAHGAFLDWGLYGKDLFLPNRNQQGGVVPGRSYTVYLYVDNITGRCVATMKLKPYIGNEFITISPHQKVDILIASESPLGYRVIVASRHWGMIYRNQIFRPVRVGEQTQAYVTRITEDNRIDLSLQQEGYEGVTSSAEDLLSLIRDAGGRIEVGDNSAPDAIHACTRMSKKVFKRALGMLLKRGAVTTDGTSVQLKESK